MHFDKEFWNYFEQEFEKEISKKNGWGKNEVMGLFKGVLTRCLMECLARQKEKT